MQSLAMVKLMPWGGAHNIALREALGLRDGEAGLVEDPRHATLPTGVD